MPLVIEDGTGKVNSESYASAAEADTYHSDRGNAAWAALPDAATKEQHLRKSTEYMSQAYRMRWKMFRVTVTQALDWPRAWVPIPDAPYGYGSQSAFVPNNVVPTEVKRACMELALSSAAGALAPQLERATRREKVGEIEVEYDMNSPEYTRFRSVDMILEPYLDGSSITSPLVRT